MSIHVITSDCIIKKKYYSFISSNVFHSSSHLLCSFMFFNNKFSLDKYTEEFDSRPSWTACLWIGEDLILGTHTGDVLLFEHHQFHSVIMTPPIKEEGMGNEITCLELITNVTNRVIFPYPRTVSLKYLLIRV